ncbi:hypothetical protein B0I31_10117 [Saccharothrix carnea]|uniref:Uncharacterized protein n=1 Tax=Saccharothrix carnea TaxID=1280637 RepID=A0A2P8IH78_SACCR|nr:hypothetical protein [Saccharothrix carnea]PSL57806.1 hypothetical protein B0I31_10117 [Saccharothrix carnea]
MNPFEEHELDQRLTALAGEVGAVLDLDAGLAAILPAAPRPAAVSAARRDRAGTTLRGFADRFAARPPHERVVARTWLPRRELAAARSFTRLRAAVLDHDRDLARARDVALTERIEHRLRGHLSPRDLVALRADLRDRARELGRDLDDVLDRAVLPALDLGFGLDLGQARAAADDLARARALTTTADHALVLAVTTVADHARGRTTTRARERLHVLLADLDLPVPGHDVGPLLRRLNTVRAAAQNVVLARDRDTAELLAVVLDQARDLALDQARERVEGSADTSARALADALATGPHDDVADAVDRITDAVTDVVDADLAHVPLDGIPLEGLRWSERTRWHQAWQDRVRRGSVELRPGLYEVQADTADAGAVT